MRTLVAALRRALAHRWLPLVLGVLAVLLTLPAARAGFQLDDHFQRVHLLGQSGPALQLFVFADGDVAENARRRETGQHPWWTAPHFRHANFRYLSVLTMQLDFALWPDRPQWMHAHSLLWLAGLVVAAALYYPRILGATWVAGLAGLLYAVDDAHVLPAAYLANRNALIATVFGILALLCFPGVGEGRRLRAFMPSAVFLALALAAGELALSVAAYLIAHALCLDRGSAVARLRSLVPTATVLLAWALVYKLGGFGAGGSGYYREPLSAPLAYAHALAQRVPVLILGQWTPIPADLASGVSADSDTGWALWAMGLATIAVLAAVLAPLLRHDAVARFFAVGATLSLLPIASVGSQNRLLFFVGLGSMGLLARLVEALVTGVPPTSRLWRGVAWTAAGVLLATHLVLAPLVAPAWIAFHERADARMVAAIASVPSDPEIAEQDLVLVNPPDYVYAVGAIPAVRSVAGLPSPRRLRALIGAPTALVATRVDAHTLRVELADGLFNDPVTRYYRAPELPFAAGERVTLDGLSIEIVALNARGDPQTLLFRFAVPLEDRSLRWLEWSEGVYKPWQPPVVGESVRLARPQHAIFQ